MNAAKKRRRIGTSTLDLVEEAVALLRQAPLTAHLAYYLGAIPFWLGLLYFISDMSRDAYAADRLVDSSLAVALLYVWDKCWQTVHAAQLRAVLAGRPDEPWTTRRVLRMIATQASYQPWGLIARGIALVVTIPFVWISSFYHNVTVLGDGTQVEGSIAGRSWTQAKLWTKQAHTVVLTIYLFTLFVWINVCILLGFLPAFLKTFLGVETTFSRGISFYFNTTFFTATIALTSLAVDPLRRAVYAIRCFRGAALNSGDDLSAELARSRARPALAVLVLFAFMLIVEPASRAETPLEAPKKADATELDHRITEVLERREFAWRTPREEKPEAPRKSKSWLKNWLEDVGKSAERWASALGRQVRNGFRWVKGLFTPPTLTPPKLSPPGLPGSLDWIGLGKALLVILGGALVVVLGWLGMRLWRERRPKAALASAVAAPTPDLRSEDVVADQLPEDGWLALAREHAARGELTLALRAAWLAGLAHLGHRELIVISRHKTNRDYDRELRRRARDRVPLLAAFDQNLSAFERSWYGKHEVTSEKLNSFEGNLDQIRQS